MDQAATRTKADVFDWTVEIRVRGHTFSAYFRNEDKKDACLEDLDLEGYSARVFFKKQLIKDWC